MSDQRVNNPYATQRATIDGVTPSAVGVKPDARLSAAFLTQAFLWMFVGLLVTAGVAFVVQSNDRLLAFAADNLFILMIAQFALVFGISLGINKISATAALGLFFVYAASLGLTIGLIVMAYTGASVVTAFGAGCSLACGGPHRQSTKNCVRSRNTRGAPPASAVTSDPPPGPDAAICQSATLNVDGPVAVQPDRSTPV